MKQKVLLISKFILLMMMMMMMMMVMMTLIKCMWLATWYLVVWDRAFWLNKNPFNFFWSWYEYNLGKEKFLKIWWLWTWEKSESFICSKMHSHIANILEKPFAVIVFLMTHNEDQKEDTLFFNPALDIF